MKRKSFCYGERRACRPASAHDRLVHMLASASAEARSTYEEYVEYLEARGQVLSLRDRMLALELSIRTS